MSILDAIFPNRKKDAAIELLDRLEKRYQGVSPQSIIVDTGHVPLSRVWREVRHDLMGKEVFVPGLNQLLFEYRSLDTIVFDWHSHPEKEVILVHHGEIHYKKYIDETEFSFIVNSGETICFKPNEMHWLRIEADTFFSQSYIPKTIENK